MYTLLRLTMIAAFALLPAIALGAGGHDGLTCIGCHSLHQAKTSGFILAVEPNTKDLNPRTKQPYGGTTGICLGCHQTPEKGGHGMTPVSAHISHPYGISSINPKVAQVPNEYLSNGRFECTSCHDPHPSNANPNYLRIGAASMESFCAVCHATKADPKTAGAKTQERQTSQPAAAKKKT